MLAKVGFLHHFLISLSPNFNVIVGKVVAKSYEMHKTMICYNGRLWENIYVSLPFRKQFRMTLEGAGFRLYRERIRVCHFFFFLDRSRDPGTKTTVIYPSLRRITSMQ